MELIEYKKYIQNLADTDSEVNFLNSDKDHATIVLSTIFNKAKKYIYLFSGDLNQGISSSAEYRSSILNFILKNGEVKILLEKYNPENEPEIFKTLNIAKLIGKNLQIKTHKSSLIDTDTNSKLHFAVSDDKMYRVEHNIQKLTAVGCFNDETSAQILKSKFLEIFNAETSISIY